MAARKYVTAEEFVKIWQTSKIVSEVQQRSGCEYRQATSRAARLRKAGVSLQYFKRGPQIMDVNKLAALAKSLEKK